MAASKKKDEAVRREQEEAWIGDAVLGLYVRELILREDSNLDGEKFARFTSNNMLSDIGNPTSVEAEIGRAYEAAGRDLAIAYQFIEDRLLPVMRRREKSFINSEKQRGEAKKKKTKRTRWAN